LPLWLRAKTRFLVSFPGKEVETLGIGEMDKAVWRVIVL
jgi:hypothetical protein